MQSRHIPVVAVQITSRHPSCTHHATLRSRRLTFLVSIDPLQWRFRALGAVGLFKACVWSYLGYTSYYYPEAAGHLSPWWSVVGLTMSAALMGAGQSLAANTVKEIVRTHAGSTARITTFNVFGVRCRTARGLPCCCLVAHPMTLTLLAPQGANAPAEVPIESLTSKDFDKGYIHLKLAGAKSFLLLDKSANIPNRSALNNLVNGRTVYMQTGVSWQAREKLL